MRFAKKYTAIAERNAAIARPTLKSAVILNTFANVNQLKPTTTITTATNGQTHTVSHTDIQTHTYGQTLAQWAHVHFTARFNSFNFSIFNQSNLFDKCFFSLLCVSVDFKNAIDKSIFFVPLSHSPLWFAKAQRAKWPCYENNLLTINIDWIMPRVCVCLYVLLFFGFFHQSSILNVTNEQEI